MTKSEIINEQHCTDDNTEGYSAAELARINAAIDAELEALPDTDDDIENEYKTICDHELENLAHLAVQS